MRARILTVATLFVAFAGVMAAKAADSQLLSLVMPDAKVLAGVNVDQAKASPLGLFVLGQMQGNHPELQQLIALTGFDPSRDVHELLAATAGTGSHDGLMLARGNFDPAKILAAATAAGAVTESYGGATIIEDPKKTGGMVFLDSTLVIAGGIAEVEAAIDHHSGQSLPAAVIDQANQWSASEDAWTFSTVPPSTLFPQTPSSGLGGNVQGVLQQVRQAGAGIKYGAAVAVTVQLQTDTAQNATQMAAALQLLANMAQMQAGQGNGNAALAALAQGLTIGAQGSTVKITATVAPAQLQQLMTQRQSAARTRQ